MRARNIKPGFFCNEDLVELSTTTRLFFIGLWCFADREGRFEARPTKIKMAIFPAESHDIETMLADLTRTGFLHFYEVNGSKFYQINNFSRHQRPHVRELESKIPSRPDQSTTQAVPEHNLGDAEPALNEECGMRNEECGKMNPPTTTQVVPVRVPDVAGQDQSETDPDIQHARLHYLQGKPGLYRGTVKHPETVAAIQAWRATPGAPKIADAEAERLAYIVLPSEAADNAREIAERVAANEFCRAKMPFAVAMKPKNAGQILAGAFPADLANEPNALPAAALAFIRGGKS